jgi:hypothetical protein
MRFVFASARILLLGILTMACEEDAPVVPADYGPAPSRSAGSAQAPDRLAPGELAEGKGEMFGLLLPRGVRVTARFAKEAHASGKVTVGELAAYIRKRVDARHVELAQGRTIFPSARVKGGPADKLFRIEVVAGSGSITKLVMRDLTRPAAVQGISEAERWRRAGLTPDGKVIDMKALE